MSARKRSRSTTSVNAETPRRAIEEVITTTATPANVHLSVLASKVIAPDADGIRCMAASNAEDFLLIARESGSLSLYRLDAHQNTAHFLPVRKHAGRRGRTIQRMHFTEADATVILGYLSGQIVVACASTLLPISVMQRSGGAIFDMTRAGPFFITAVADGTWRTLFYDSKTYEVEHYQTTPKVTGADRALCVAVSSALSMAVGGDDGGNVVAWSFPHVRSSSQQDNSLEAPQRLADVERIPHQQLWCCRIAKGFPLALGVVSDAFTPCVAVGSSIGDVMLLDVQSGAPFRRFSHHKGPVSTIAVANKMFYASGWHESLRSYRCQEEEPSSTTRQTAPRNDAAGVASSSFDAPQPASVGEWYPSEVKRRTHYHEASQLLILDKKLQWLLSASKDGTVMHSPVATVFSSASHYLDATSQSFAFATNRNVLVQTRGRHIEAFRMTSSKAHWVPVFSLGVDDDKYGLTGVWCNDNLDVVITATDRRLQVIRVEWPSVGSDSESHEPLHAGVSCGVAASISAAPMQLTCLESKAAVGTIDCAFDADSGSAYVLCATELVQISIATSSGATTTAPREKPVSSVTMVSTTLTEIFHFVSVVPAASMIFLAGPKGCVAYPLLPGGFVDTTSTPTIVTTLPVDSVSGGMALVRGKGYISLAGEVDSTEKKFSAPFSLPHDTVFLPHPVALCGSSSSSGASNCSSSSSGRLAYFSKGLITVDEKSWNMVQRVACVKCFQLKDSSSSVLVLERNVEATVEGLPLCWKVRRFGN